MFVEIALLASLVLFVAGVDTLTPCNSKGKEQKLQWT